MKTVWFVSFLAFFGVYMGCAAGGSTDSTGNQAGTSGATNLGGTANGGSSGSATGGGGSANTTCTPQSCDDNNPCTTDTCGASGCTHDDNTAPCDDDNDVCTSDFCHGGICTHPATGDCDCHAGADCDDNNPCTDDSCDANHKCKYTNNTAPCADDGNECRDDICTDGTCQHPNKVGPCTDDNDPCTDDMCNGAMCAHTDNGTCQCMVAADCDDGKPCTDDDCVGRQCIHTNNTAPCASDVNPCTDDVCAAGACTHPFNTAPCAADTNPCTDDLCNAGNCTHVATTTANVPCATDNNPCTDDVCNPNASGTCSHVNNTAPCADENPAFACTDDVCAAGACTHVDNHTCACISGAQCDDGNACTTDTCTNLGACVNTNNTAPCAAADTDTDQCTFDICAAGACTHPDNGACFPDGGLIGTPFTVDSFNSSADWNGGVNAVTTTGTATHYPLVVTGTAGFNLEGNNDLYLSGGNPVGFEMGIGANAMAGILHLVIQINGDGTSSMITVGVYDGAAWTDLPLSNYLPALSATQQSITVNTLDFGVPLGSITKVRINFTPSGTHTFRIYDISAS